MSRLTVIATQIMATAGNIAGGVNGVRSSEGDGGMKGK